MLTALTILLCWQFIFIYLFLWSALCNFPQTLAWLYTGWYISLSLRDLDDVSLVTGLLLNCISFQWKRNIEGKPKTELTT